MCCPLHQQKGKFTLESAYYIDGTDQVYLKGSFDKTPKSYVLRGFQHLELLEKIFEIADESFHLLNDLLRFCTNSEIYQTLHDAHHGAHVFEHLLHSSCFFGDVVRLYEGTFLKDQEGKSLDFLRSLSRVCHATAHCFATIQFLTQHRLFLVNQIDILKYGACLSTLGYALWAVSLVWQRYQGEVNEQFNEDMCIHLGGCLFEASHCIEAMNILAPSLNFALSKLGSLAGVIHASFVVRRLTPKDKEEIETTFTPQIFCMEFCMECS